MLYGFVVTIKVLLCHLVVCISCIYFLSSHLSIFILFEMDIIYLDYSTLLHIRRYSCIFY